MSDVIICINIDESKRKKRFIVETYEGAIPNLKSQKYSGQLRNTDVMTSHSYSNVDNDGLSTVKQVLSMHPNIQISKHQFIIAQSNIDAFFSLVNLGCVFYKDRKTAMYRIVSVSNNITGTGFYEFDGVRIKGEQTTVFYELLSEQSNKTKSEVIAKVYINLTEKNHPLDLLFDYEDTIVNYTNKDRIIEKTGLYRDYGFEEQTITCIESHNWVFHKATGFEYVGKKLPNDIVGLVNNGITVFTNNKKRIATADFSDIRVSYDIDWFSVKGDVKIDQQSVEISELFDLKKKHESWVEFNGKVVFLPEALNDKSLSKNHDGNLILDKKKITKAISIAKDVSNTSVKKIDELIDYSQIILEIDRILDDILRPYQRDGIRWLLSLKENGFGGCLADDMGLGKTLQIICYLNDRKCAGNRSLIVVPKTLLINWEREFKKYDPKQSIYIYHGTNRSFETALNHNVIISTYQTVLNDYDQFNQVHFDNLIIDEAQYIKNSKSKAHRAMKGINASTKILLTGTPVENNLEEYWGLMRLINPDSVDSYSTVNKHSDNLVDHIRLITAPFLLRRLKTNVLKELPEKQEQTVYVEMEGEQLDLYNKMLDSIKYEITRKSDRFEIKSNSIMLNGLLYLQEICCHPALLNKDLNPGGCKQSAKLDLLLDLVMALHETNHKVVVFSRFTQMLQLIEKKLKSLNIKSFYLDGKTRDRMDIVDSFENSAKGVFLISLKAGGTGLNLVSADTAIIYDPWWNPASEKQAEDRIYRIGQTKNVMIYRLIVSGTIEEKVQSLQNDKKELCSQILEGHEMPVKLTAELLKGLILE